MIRRLLSFALILLLFTAALIPLNFYILEELLGTVFNTSFYATYGYFYFITLLFFAFLNKKMEGRPQAFVSNFMAAMGGKLFLSLLVLTSHIYFNKSGMKIYAVNFMVLYLLYSFLGSYQILRINKKQNV